MASSRMRLDPRPEFENSWGSIHGGVLMSVLDVVLSSSGRSLDETCIGATTVEIKINFIAAARGACWPKAAHNAPAVR